MYQICKNPNTRIMWVGGNEDIAKNALSAVLDVLDTNEELREDFCPPVHLLNQITGQVKTGHKINLL